MYPYSSWCKRSGVHDRFDVDENCQHRTGFLSLFLSLSLSSFSCWSNGKWREKLVLGGATENDEKNWFGLMWNSFINQSIVFVFERCSFNWSTLNWSTVTSPSRSASSQSTPLRTPPSSGPMNPVLIIEYFQTTLTLIWNWILPSSASPEWGSLHVSDWRLKKLSIIIFAESCSTISTSNKSSTISTSNSSYLGRKFSIFSIIPFHPKPTLMLSRLSSLFAKMQKCLELHC